MSQNKNSWRLRAWHDAVIEDANGTVVARSYSVGEAEQIIREHNAHAELVHALETIRDGMADDKAYRQRAREALAYLKP